MNPATPMTITTPTTCPDWCTDTHTLDERTPNEHGFWNLLHTSTPVPVVSGEVLPNGVAVELEVSTEEYHSETTTDWVPRTLLVKSVDQWGTVQSFSITARQALLLTEVLGEQASDVLTQEASCERR